MTTVVAVKRERAVSRSLLNVLIDRSRPGVWIWSSITVLVVVALMVLVVYNGPSHIVAP
jgi:hypothetical protein